MENITLELLLYLAAGAALGGYVNGLAGFGTGLMSLGIWLQVMSVEEAVPVVAAMSVVSGMQSLWLTRQGVKTGLHRLPRFLVPALIGLPVGAWLLNWIDAAHLKLAVAFFMLFYTAFFLLLPEEFRLGAHHWILLHGRYCCTARKPQCSKCPISDLCRWPEKELS